MACNSFATRILPIFCVIKSNKITLSSPRSWGCFCSIHVVYPFLVGLPHARGGVSSLRAALRLQDRSSPRSWGCFSAAEILVDTGVVFPTLVGVFLRRCAFESVRRSLPHARGGVSQFYPYSHPRRQSSPRSWGCFYMQNRLKWLRKVFPTLVGVFLIRRPHHRWLGRLPHARGGVSEDSIHGTASYLSSPRSWGCF